MIRQTDQDRLTQALNTVGIRQEAGRERPKSTFKVQRNKQMTSGLGNRCKLFLSRNSKKKKPVFREDLSEA